MNDRSFEDCERTMVELKSFFFNTVYLKTSAFGGKEMIEVLKTTRGRWWN
jgi:hypothetical protein